jgi:filamentous hemagglutinin
MLLICSLMFTSTCGSANARFISPDTFDPTQVGVGTNRYAYAGNDPINRSDPNGHFWGVVAAGIAALLGGAKAANAPNRGEKPSNMSDGRSLANSAAAAGAVTGGVGLLGSLRSLFEKKESTKETVATEQRVGRGTTETTSGAELKIDSRQLGKKLGQHVTDYGGDPGLAADRARVTDIINDIGNNPDRIVDGTFKGQGLNNTRGPVQFRIKGNDVVVTKPDGTFVTVMKDGVNNSSVQRAIRGIYD